MEELKYCDFHLHSKESDGDLSRGELIKAAMSFGIGAMAITDHNICLTSEELFALRRAFPEITLLNGAEVSVCYRIPDTGKNHEIHIVALDIKDAETFSKAISCNIINKKEYVTEILHKLREVGVDLNCTYSDFEKNCVSNHIGRNTVAQRMVELGFAKNKDEAYDEYIGDYGKKRAYVAYDAGAYLPLDVAVKEIVRAGGIAVLCHPLNYTFTEEQLLDLVTAFISAGGTAIESNYSAYNSRQRQYLKGLAERFGLKESAASDFHSFSRVASMDNRFPISIYDNLFDK